ncbi:MAG TPA: hypothetical protein VHL11_10980, partial [Phototrophicaceae bacterium]|nr:hypothetical protein [Phototrophicaceae bacterium]
MTSFILLIMNAWILSAIALLAHRLRPRFGAAPLLALIGGLTVLVHNRYGVYLEPFPGIIMFITSSVFVPVILMSILILYVANGSVAARLTILSVIGLSLITMVQIFILGIFLGLPGGNSVLPEVTIQTMLQARD